MLLRIISIIAMISMTVGLAILSTACNSVAKQDSSQLAAGGPRFRLLTLDPGHFHAALVQKSMNPDISPEVHVYSPGGFDLQEHLKRIDGYNKRTDNPARWDEKVYEGADFLEKMLQERAGNIVILAGNNSHKTEYIKKSVDAGLNVLSDKPMCIDPAGYARLKEAFESARKNKVLLYDIMTERYEITTRLQKAISESKEVFGELQKGTAATPAVTKESVHHLYKQVSGKPLIRPQWYFDTEQQGEGIVDVTTHLVDLVFWECFPETAIQVSDLELVKAKRWATAVSREQFAKVTGTADFPGPLKAKLDPKGSLNLFSNGEIVFKVKGVYVKTSVIWNYEAPAGGGDTHYSTMKGTRASVSIRQGKEENYRPELYVTPASQKEKSELKGDLDKLIAKLQKEFPGIGIKESGEGWMISIPDSFRDGHEAHFSQVAAKYLRFLSEGNMPAWEVPNMLAKYYVTTEALKLAGKK